MLTRRRENGVGIAVELFLCVGGDNHRNHRKHHTLVAGRQIIKKFLAFFALQFHVIRDNSREVVVLILLSLPVGYICLNTEQTVFNLPHCFIGGNRNNINAHHHISVEIGKLRNHAVLDIRCKIA
ncbi:hypothetical protein SDC9_208714 [bioreactor metagenome]|uniref:Uncharacterized protein n=1 Tax=bioreactor metagenome TaxID=1076179 RepID=A0A645JD32_9ZZZZ